MLHVLWVVCKWLVIAAAVITLAVAAFIYFHPTFGGKPDAQSLARIRASPNFNGEVFVNIEPTDLMAVRPGDRAERPSMWAWLNSVTNPPPGKQPAVPVPNVALNADALQDGNFVWLGHSTVIMKLAGKTLLTDPVFHRASPVFLGGAPFAMTHTYTADDMPKLNAVLISHDHYDHLDYRAIRELSGKTEHFYVPLGVKAHLQRWGVSDDKITEMDWHESAMLGEVRITFAPSRHFSGRNFTNRHSTLWGSWAIHAPTLALYFNADSGFGKHFALNAEKYGPFDVAFMENGAYNEQWPLIHMTPEQSVQAAQILGAKQVVPVHWGKFDLAYHPWKEPIERFLAEAERLDVAVATPVIGAVFNLQAPPKEKWWENVP